MRRENGGEVNSRVIGGGGSGGCVVFVEERPRVAAASTLVANSVDPRNRSHSSPFGLHFELSVQDT